MQTLLRRPATANVFRYFVGGTAAIVLLLSLFPRGGLEAGVLLYFILWPLLGMQLGVAFLPWQKFALKRPWLATITAAIIILGIFYVDIFMLTLAGYIQP